MPDAALPPPPPPQPAAGPPVPSWQAPWQAGQPAPWPAQPQSRAGRTVAIVAGGVLAALAALVGIVTLFGTAQEPYPAQWDPRVEPLVRFVEQERGMPFKHPVHIDFVDATTFDAALVEGVEPTEEERAESERYTGLYRAFGLVSGELDLLDSGDQLLTEGVAAFYATDTKRITIDGTELDPATMVTVVHELVHAWQDQHLDFDEIESRLEPDEYAAYTAAVEGDASRVESAYFWYGLTERQRAAAMETYTADYEASDLGGLPPVLLAEFGAPYVLGEPFVGILAAVRGDTAVDDAIQNPTAGTKALIDPFSRLDGERPVPVAEPALRAGEERFDGGSLGALFVYLVLNERVGPMHALAAADGWAGDGYVAFTRDSRTCVRVDIETESMEAMQRMSDAIGAWAAAMPAGSAQWNVAETISLETCDPGAVAVLPAPVLADVDPLLVPTFRMNAAFGLVHESGDVEFARCATAELMNRVAIEHMTVESVDHSEALNAAVVDSGAACDHLR